MSTVVLLNVDPSVLKFPFEFKKQSSCSMKLTDKTDKHVAFKVKTTNPKKLHASDQIPVSFRLEVLAMLLSKCKHKMRRLTICMRCKDKVLVQSVHAADGAATTENIKKPEMFSKGDGKVVEEFKTQDNRKVLFRVERSSHLKPLMDGYCVKMNLEIDSISFFV